MGVRRRVRGASLGAVLALSTVLAACTTPTPTPVTPIANPDLATRCGIDINLIIDRSNSVEGSAAQSTAAAQALVDALGESGARVRLASFGAFGSGHPNGQNEASFDLNDLPWSNAAGYTVPPLTHVSGPFGPAFPDPGSTNLEGGLEVIRRAPGPVGDLTIVFSDGEPNEQYLSSPDGSPGPNVNLGGALTEAIGEANRLKQMGTHMLAVGVSGWAGITRPTLQAISGPDRVGDVPIQEADYVDLDSFDQAVPALTDIAHQLCHSSLTVTKFARYQGEYQRLCNWGFDVTAAPEPLAWFGGGNKPAKKITTCLASNQTDPRPYGGTTSIAWDPSSSITAVTLQERTGRGYSLESVTCTKGDPAGGPRIPIPATIVDQAAGIFSVNVGSQDDVSCNVYNRIVDSFADSGGLILNTYSADPADGETLVSAALQGAPPTTVATPGIASFIVAPGAPSLSLTAPAGWYLSSLVCDGIELPSPLLAQVVVQDGRYTQCDVTVSKTPTVAYLNVIAAMTIECGAFIQPQPVTWALRGPDGNTSEQVGNAGKACNHQSAPVTMSWAVTPGGAQTLTTVPTPSNLVLTSLSCRETGGPQITLPVPFTSWTYTPTAGQVMTCSGTYTVTGGPATLDLTSSVVSDDGGDVPSPLADPVKWEVTNPILTTNQQMGSTDDTLHWDLLQGVYHLVESPQLDHLRFDSISCELPNAAPFTSFTPDVTMTLAPGDSARCKVNYTYHAGYID